MAVLSSKSKKGTPRQRFDPLVAVLVERRGHSMDSGCITVIVDRPGLRDTRRIQAVSQSEPALRENLEKQKVLEERKKIFNSNAAMIKRKAEAALRENLEKQKVLERRKKIFNSNAAMVRVVMFTLPYFKNQYNMVPVAMLMPPYFEDQYSMHRRAAGRIEV